MADRYIFASVLAALLLAACSGADEPLSDDNGSTVPTDTISYTVAASLTRSTVIRGTEFPIDESFRVWAFEEDDATLIDGGIVSCTNGLVWSTSEKYYWPQGDGRVSFFALYPNTLSMDKDTKSFSYVVPGDVSSQQDVLYDAVTAGKTDDGVSHNPIKRYAVPLTFHHALTQVAFKGCVSANNPEWTVSVSAITLCNVASRGTFDLTTMKWKGLAGLKDFSVGIRSDAGAFGYASEAIDLTAPDGVLLMIPQTLRPWDTDDYVVNTYDCYLAIDCHIRQGYIDIIGTATQPATIYVPFNDGPTSWKQGYRYNYTLEFGEGYNAEGERELQALVASSEITDWAEGGDDDLGAKMTQNE